MYGFWLVLYHVLFEIGEIIVFANQMTCTFFFIQKKIMSLQDTLMIKGGQDPVLLFETLEVLRVIFASDFDGIVFVIFEVFAFVDDGVASLANFLVEFVAVFEALLDGDLASKIDILEGFEVFTGLAEPFFDGGLRSGLVVSFVVEVLGFNGELGLE